MIFGFLNSLMGGGKVTRDTVAANAKQGNFNKQDLAELDLSGIKFVQAEFNKTNLGGVSFAGGKLTQCDFKDANLRNANLQGARFVQCEFKRSDFGGAQLAGATFEQCEFKGARLETAQGADQARFEQCELKGTALEKQRSGGSSAGPGAAASDAAADALWATGDVNAALIAAQQQSKQMMANAVKPEQLAPIEGVTLETYATAAANMARVQDASQVPGILAQFGLDEAKYRRVDQAWQARMRQAEDPMAAAAIASEYGKYFAAAGQGQYGAAAQGAANQIGIHGQVGAGPAGGEPCTLERYAEIMGAQSAWAQQGRDVNAMLQSQFGMTALDWSNMGAYWSMKMATDYQLAMKLGDLQQKYTQQYLGAGGGPDDDLAL